MTEQIAEATIPNTVSAVPRGLTEDRFAELVREHQGMVFSIAYSCLRDRAVAEEVAQDVFLELYRSRSTFESAGHAVNWLRRVAAHRSIDRIRRRQPFLALVDVREPAAVPVPGDVLLQENLRQLVASLPPKPRMVMILRFQEDLDPSEIAEILEMPVRTVKSHLQRSIVLLREKLARRSLFRH
jgi:RNA polymerase sigma-70 factor, ECF subfamily